MPKITSPMDVYKLLNGSNCRECGEKTCLAFSVAVFKNKKTLERCPHLSPKIIESYGGQERPNTIDEYMDEAVEDLKRQVAGIDLEKAAERLSARYDGGKLMVKVMGKDFSVAADGSLSSDIHVNAWLAVPVLNYILHGAGKPVSGQWATFRELNGGMERLSHFQQRCERPLKQLADSYPDLFRDMLDIFNGRKVDSFDSDVAVVLHPLPLLPIMVCYWEPEEGMESSLHMYYDQSADQNLDAESIYTLTAGMVMMFEKLALRHGIRAS